MIYLDNAATSGFKPQAVFDCLNYDLTHSANSGRSGHRYALDAAMKIEDCRRYLLGALGASDGYNIVFTKNCTEAINLGIFGFLREGMRVVTSTNEHNSVLRPLYELKKRGRIELFVINQNEDGSITPEHVDRAMENANFCVISAASNVTGARADLDELGKSARRYGVITLVDGAQAIPVVNVDMAAQGLDMLAVPGHKGLHGVQGTGFLIFRKELKLQPIVFGGTGTASDSVYQPSEAPEAYEAGTLFAGGIAALHAGAKWSYAHLENTRRTVKKLAYETMGYLKAAGADVYTKDPTVGVVSFNIKGRDSSEVADKLAERDIAVRSGLHCAPLVHRFLKTTETGAVRASIGADTAENDIYAFMEAVERIIAAPRAQYR